MRVCFEAKITVPPFYLNGAKDCDAKNSYFADVRHWLKIRYLECQGFAFFNHFGSFFSRLRGMNETCVKFKVGSVNADVAAIKKKIYECANVLQVGGY